MESLTGALKNVFQTYGDKSDEVKNDKSDEVKNEVENVFKTYRDVIDKMRKLCLSHMNRLS